MSHPFNDDTQPNLILPNQQTIPTWRRVIGLLSLLGAMGLTFATVLLIMTASPPADSPAPEPSSVVQLATEIPTDNPTKPPTDIPPTLVPTENTDIQNTVIQELPTLSADKISSLLASPLQPVDEDTVLETTGLSYDPFTIIPNRARSQMTSYTAVRGDTIDAISDRFGITRETIAWCNDYRLALVLRPGDVVNVPPTDGACHTVLASQGKDITAIAKQYKVDDPYAIIDAPVNGLPDISPDTQLPSGTQLFIPGGEGSIITWDAPVEQDSSGNVIAFAPGQAGSCGSVGGGGSFWTNPLPSATWIRGFYAGHSGLDLAAPFGTPVIAANSGPILFAGWNSWGYGNAVVIGHGPFSTLYGHMSRLAVACGNTVSAGQVIGYVGSTGNSSGPHLHFELRFQNQPQNPSLTSGIGW
jgi:murein DD-endopeptidase MepM/ murein hydrolase activator NlpD